MQSDKPRRRRETREEKLHRLTEIERGLWADGHVIAGIDETARKKRIVHPNTFLKEDDKEFALRLLSESIVRYDEYFKLLEEHLDNWKSDRLVSTDAALIVMGITGILIDRILKFAEVKLVPWKGKL